MTQLYNSERDAEEISETDNEEQAPLFGGGLKRRTLSRAPGGGMVTPTLILSIFSAAVGGAFTMGYNTSVINSPADNIKNFFDEARRERGKAVFSDSAMTNYWSLNVSVYCLSALFGCFMGSYSAKKLGRKDSMMYNNILCVVGAFLQVACVNANSYEMFTAGRVITGLNNGANTVLVNMYLSEIPHKDIRGAVGTVFQLSVVVGVLAAEVLSFGSILGGADTWPYLFLIPLGCALIQCLTLPFCPESPRFLLIERDEKEKCRDALLVLRDIAADVDGEMLEIEAEDAKQKSEPVVSYKDLFTVGYLRRPLIISSVMAASQQLSGINAVNYYSASIFESALPADKVADNPDLPNYFVALTGVCLLIMTIISLSLIDKIGRKISHLIGLTGMAFSALIVAFMLSDKTTEDNQTCHGIETGEPGNYIAIVFIFIYTSFFGMGPGSVPWLIAPELFSAGPRPKAMSISNGVNWICNFFIAQFFSTIQEALCGWVFLIFFVLLIIFVVYLFYRLPEIKGMPIDQIIRLFADEAVVVRYNTTLEASGNLSENDES